ncbi:MAG: MATE family efflux transporter, partial [Myxococcota bacterium]
SFEVLAAGAGPLIARATGAADPRMRRAILGAGLWGAGVVTVLVMATGTLCAGWIAASVGLTGATAEAFALYLSALSLTILPLVLTPLVDQVFLAIGEARLPMALHVASLALNILLTPLFVLVLEGGVVGAALASNLARAVTTGVGLFVLVRKLGLQRMHIRPTDQLFRILRVGTPMAASTALYALVYWALLRWTVSPLGPHVNAALGIGFSALEGMAWPVFHGLSLAVASLVGRYLGAGRPDLAWGVVKLAFPATTALGLFASTENSPPHARVSRTCCSRDERTGPGSKHFKRSVKNDGHEHRRADRRLRRNRHILHVILIHDAVRGGEHGKHRARPRKPPQRARG